MAQKKKDDQPEVKDDQPVARMKVGRGSDRRIAKAAAEFDSAIASFIKEMDLQFYASNEKGERVGPWEFVSALRDVRKEVAETVNEQLYPSVDATDEE